MLRVSRLSRRPLAVAAAALLTGTLIGAASVAAAATAGQADHPRRVAPPRTGAAAGQVSAGRSGGGQTGAGQAAAAPGEFATTANPLTLDPPVAHPPTTPVTVTIASHDAFGNGPPPATKTATLPSGHWAQVDLEITGTEQGVQYDRLCEVFDGQSEIFLGVTPEPTPAGITWHAEKDITGYLPLLTGVRTFSTYVDNYLSAADTGIPVITAKLLFYPAGGSFHAAAPASAGSPALAGDAINETGPASPAGRPGVPRAIVPITPAGEPTTLNQVITGQTLSATVRLPDNVTTASLDLYAAGQQTDEFWWSLAPAFREIEVSVDGKPAGVVWPYPYVYTGGVNPLIWRPVTGIHTMDIPSYRLDLTPFAGMLGGSHTISLTVVGNAGYWLAGGSLLVTASGAPTSGGVTSDTLAPTTSESTSTPILGGTGQAATTEAAASSYEISGKVSQGGKSWTDTVRQKLTFSDDQSVINSSCSGPCYQWVHAEETQESSETTHGPGACVTRQDSASWTIDAPNGYLPGAGGAFYLPATVSQQLTDHSSQTGGALPAFAGGESESVIGYGALEAEPTGSPITDGDTTGTVTDEAPHFGPAGPVYQRTVVARGGQILQDLTEP